MTDIKTGEAKLTIPNFSGFATIPHANDALSRAICVQNLPWRFLVRMESNNTHVAAYLECLRTTVEWECQAYAEFIIKSQKIGQAAIEKKISVCTFTHLQNSWGLDLALTEEILNANNGWLVNDELSVEMKIGVHVPYGLRNWKNTESLAPIKIDDQYIDVNKYLLCLHSEFFRERFDQTSGRFTGLEIKLDPPTNVDCFKLMVDILEGKAVLEDEFIEGLFLLATRFQMNELIGKCRKFLLQDSNKLGLTKYVIAKKCCMPGLQADIMKNLTMGDLTGQNLFEIHAALKQLGEEDMKALRIRHAQIYADL